MTKRELQRLLDLLIMFEQEGLTTHELRDVNEVADTVRRHLEN